MEIWDYLRTCGWRKWLLVVLPAIGVVVGIVLAANTATTYQGVATVVPPASTDASVSAGTVDQFVEDYRSIATSEAVLRAASRETEVPVADMRDNVSTERIATSRVVEVSFNTSDRDTAPTVAEAVARAALAAIYRPGVDVARARVEGAQGRYDAAVKAVDDYATEVGEPVPPDELAVQSSQLAQLEIALAQASADGDLARVARLQPQVDAFRQAIPRLRNESRTYERLSDEAKTVLASLEDARRDLQEAKTRVGLATRKSSVAATGPTTISPTRAYLRMVLGSAAIGVLLGIVVLAVMELLWPKRRRNRRQTALDAQGFVEPRAAQDGADPTVRTLDPPAVSSS